MALQVEVKTANYCRLMDVVRKILSYGGMTIQQGKRCVEDFSLSRKLEERIYGITFQGDLHLTNSQMKGFPPQQNSHSVFNEKMLSGRAKA